MARIRETPLRTIAIDADLPVEHHPLRRFRGMIVVIGLCAVAYANSLGNGFVYDDVAIILDNPAVAESLDGHAVPWYEAWRRPYWPETNTRSHIDVLYRPFVVQTYAWDMRLLGPSGWWFHLVNVALHAAAAVALLRVARQLTNSATCGFVAGCLFAVHPIHTEAVAGIVGRAEILTLLGVLGTLIATDRLLLARRVWAIGALGLAAAVFAAVAVFSKESGAGVIPTTVAYAWWRRRHSAGSPRVWRRCLPLMVVMVAMFAAYLVMRYQVCGGRLRITGQMGGTGNVLREITGWPRWITWVSILGRYVWLMVWPERLLADYSYAVVRPTTSPLEPFFLLGITTLAVLGFVKYRSWRGTGAALVAVAAFAFSYILVSNSVILIAVMMAERWFYAPSAWLTILVVMAGRRVLAGSLSAERWPRLHQLAAPQAALVVIVAVLCVRTWYRNADWGSFDRLLAADVRATPPGGRSAHFQASLAARQVAQGRLGEAEANAREAVATYPESATIQCVLGEVLLARGKTAEAVEVLEEARRIDPRDPQVAAALEQSRLAAAGEDARAGLERTLAVLKVRPGDAEAQYQAGYYLEALGEFQQAAGHYRRAAELQPQRVKAWLAWAGALAAAACPAEAIDVYRQILARWPNEWQAHANIAMQLMQKAAGTLWQPEEAVRHAERALQLGPAEMRLQLTINLAEVLYEVGQSARAADVYDGLVRSLPSDDPQRSRYRERIEYLRGQ